MQIIQTAEVTNTSVAERALHCNASWNSSILPQDNHCNNKILHENQTHEIYGFRKPDFKIQVTYNILSAICAVSHLGLQG